MISTVLAMLLLQGPPGIEALSKARNHYNQCLSGIMKTELKADTEEAAFASKLAASCTAEEAAFRSASIKLDVAAKIARAAAEQNATDEIGYIRENMLESFKAYRETNTSPR